MKIGTSCLLNISHPLVLELVSSSVYKRLAESPYIDGVYEPDSRLSTTEFSEVLENYTLEPLVLVQNTRLLWLVA